MVTDAELLQRHVADRDEQAFAALVQRHLDLVYAAALRRTNGRHALAEEIAQKVFTDLANQAARLVRHPTLAGWLHRSTRNKAVDAIRAEQRRTQLTQALTSMSDSTSPAESSPDWEQLRPVIDASLDQLKEQDREVILLRFFQGRTFGEIGEQLNLTENTARMRTQRALDKLRLRLGERGIASTAALGAVLAGQPLVAAPAGLVSTVTSTSLTTSTTATMTGTLTPSLLHPGSLATSTALLTVAVTWTAWFAFTDRVGDDELAALHAENNRLTLAVAEAKPATPTAGPSFPPSKSWPPRFSPKRPLPTPTRWPRSWTSPSSIP